MTVSRLLIAGSLSRLHGAHSFAGHRPRLARAWVQIRRQGSEAARPVGGLPWEEDVLHVQKVRGDREGSVSSLLSLAVVACAYHSSHWRMPTGTAVRLRTRMQRSMWMARRAGQGASGDALVSGTNLAPNKGWRQTRGRAGGLGRRAGPRATAPSPAHASHHCHGRAFRLAAPAPGRGAGTQPTPPPDCSRRLPEAADPSAGGQEQSGPTIRQPSALERHSRARRTRNEPSNWTGARPHRSSAIGPVRQRVCSSPAARQ